MKNLNLNLQYASAFKPLPSESQIRQYMELALSKESFSKDTALELTLRFVDIEEIRALNFNFRQKDKATNVLSFPFEMPVGLVLPQRILGDIVICPEILLQEAAEQDKPYENHFAHMVIHGVLHLLGYDHDNEVEADVMESLEIELLNILNIRNPYQSLEN